MEKKKFTYNAIKSLSNDDLKQAYHELKVGLPKGNQSLVRRLQSTLYHENGKTVPLLNVMYHVSMEMLERFYE